MQASELLPQKAGRETLKREAASEADTYARAHAEDTRSRTSNRIHSAQTHPLSRVKVVLKGSVCV